MALSGYPPAPSGVSNNAASTRGWGSGWPNCQTANIVLITIDGGARFWMRREIAELTRLLLNECVRRGYQIRRADSGGYNCRPIDGSNPPVASNHSWALAVDLNWNSNPLGAARTDIPRWMVELLWSFGFYWGGWYSRLDTMHFEYVRTPAQAAADTARARQAFGGEDLPVEQSTFNNLMVKAFQDTAVATALGNAIKGIRTGFSAENPGGFTFGALLLDAADESDIPVSATLDPAVLAAAIAERLPAQQAHEFAAAVAQELSNRLSG